MSRDLPPAAGQAKGSLRHRVRLEASEQHLTDAVAQSWTRLQELREQYSTGRVPAHDLAVRVAEDLRSALEELRVSAEELRTQNAELAESASALARERQRYHDLFHQAPDAYVVTDTRGIILDANRAAAQLFAVGARELRGKPLEVYLPRAVQRLIAARRGTPESQAGAREWQTAVRPRGGERIPVGVRFAQVERSEEATIRWLLRDVTERQRAEEQARQLLQEQATRVALERAHAELEARIAERTAELARTNQALQDEISERRRSDAERSELLRQLASVEEDERRRIARELHDEMGQLVTGLQLGLKSLELEADAGDRRPRIVELERLADRIARATQHLALELRPPALDRLGLVPALQAHLEERSGRTAITCDFHSSGLTGERLPAEVETTLYRVVQEGLTNVLKHASASRVSLIVERRHGYVTAILEDNGRGFDVEAALAAAAKAKRLGLHGMRERVALLGGTLEIESSSGTGTTLFVRVPDAG